MNPKRCAVIALASVALVGCVDSAEPAAVERVEAMPTLPSIAHGAQLDSTVALVGTYSVPVPIDLVPFASYDVAIFVTPAKQPGDTFEISFALPEGLFGFTAEATFTGTAASITGDVAVSGKWGAGTCHQGAVPTCDLAYYNFHVDQAVVLEFWQLHDGASAINHVKVSQLFDADPLGVLAASAPARVTL